MAKGCMMPSFVEECGVQVVASISTTATIVPMEWPNDRQSRRFFLSYVYNLLLNNAL